MESNQKVHIPAYRKPPIIIWAYVSSLYTGGLIYGGGGGGLGLMEMLMNIQVLINYILSFAGQRVQYVKKQFCLQSRPG